MIRHKLLCTAAWMALAPQAAFAQDVATKVVADRQQAGAEDIIVTANRRAEPLQTVPITVTVLSGDALAERGIQNPQDLERLVSTVSIQNNGGNQQATNFSVRGVGTASFQRSAEASVATVLDDVTLIRPDMAIINFVDIESIEVLNGPQGFLFGKNASAGLVNIHTQSPQIGSNTGRFVTEYGTLNTAADTSLFRMQGIANIATGRNSALRVNAFVVDNDKLMTPVNPQRRSGSNFGLRQIGGSAKFLWEPAANISVLLGADYSDGKGAGGGFANVRSTLPGSPLDTAETALGIVPGPNNTKTGADALVNFRNEVWGAQAKASFEFDGGMSLTNIAAYRELTTQSNFDVDYSALPWGQSFPGRIKARQWSDELRLASPSGTRFEYQVGLFALNGYVFEGTALQATLGMAVPPGFTTVLGTDSFYRQKLGSYAAYGQASYELAPGLKLTAGGRVTHDTIDMFFRTTAGGGVIPLLPVAAPPAQTESETNLSGRASLQYEISPRWMIFGTAARGYKGPGYSQYSLSYVKPEIPTHFEIGSKTQFFDRRVTLNVSLYNTEFRDFQAQSIDITSLTFKLQNAGKLRARGVDVQLLARPVKGLTLNGGLSYSDARFITFVNDVCYVGQANCVGGVSNSSGNRLPNAPEWKAVADASYEVALGAGNSAIFNAGVKTQSAFNFLSNNDPKTTQSGYTTLDTSIALTNSIVGGTLRLFCRNCTDRRFVANIVGHPFVPGDYIQNLSISGYRQLGLSLDLKI